MYYIYRLQSPSGKSYIGQTRQKKGIDERFKQHVFAWEKWIKEGRPRKAYGTVLFYAFDKYHPSLWEVSQIAVAKDQEECNILETENIALYDSINNGYNIQKGGQGWRDQNISDGHKKNIGKSRKEFFETEDGQRWKEVLSERFKEDNPSKKGRTPWNKGKKCPEISEAKKANPTVFTEERKQATSERVKRLWEAGVFDNRPKPSEEHKQRIGAANKGKKQTDYQKQAAREANLQEYEIIWRDGRREEFRGIGDFSNRTGIPLPTLMYILKKGTDSWKWNIQSLKKKGA